MAVITISTKLTPEIFAAIEEVLRGDRVCMLGTSPTGKVEIFSVRSKPQDVAGALAYQVGMEVEDVAELDPAESEEIEINIELH